MVWKIEIDPAPQRVLNKLDPPIARRIVSFLYQRVAHLENPRSIGEALTGNELGDFWKYRVGDFRIVAEIEHKVLRITVIKIGNRREVYR